MEFNSEKFSKDLVLFRSHKMRWTLKKASIHAGIPIATLSRMERGGLPELNSFARACRWMGVDMGIYFNPLSGGIPKRPSEH